MTWFYNIRSAKLVTALMLLLPFIASATTLTIGSGTNSPGGTISVPVSLGAASGGVGIQFDLVYPKTNLLLSGVTSSTLTNFQVRSSEVSEGVQRVLIYSSTNSLLPDGELVNVLFTLASNFVEGAAALSFTNSVLASGDGSSILPLSTTGGHVSTIAQPPAITSQPVSRTVAPGTNVTFSVEADGTAPLAFQWQKNQISITNATNASYAITTVGTNDAGSYRVVVSNAKGSVTSASATLVVALPPQITSQPHDQTVNVGGTATFEVLASGSSPFNFQWSRNGTNIAGATLSRYIKPNVQTADAGSYSVHISNAAGSVMSSNGLLSVVTCTYAVSPGSITFSYTGGKGSVAVTSSSSCPWTATTTNSWITITNGSSRVGNGSAGFTVAANIGISARTGFISVEGKQIIVAQGPQFAPANLRGKTIILTVTSGSGTLAASGKYLLVTGAGTTNSAQIVPLTGTTPASSGIYTLVRSNATQLVLRLNGATNTFKFTNATRGTFTARKAGGTQTGSFIAENKTADFDGDGRGDIAWQNATTRVLTSWSMQGTTYLRSASLRKGAAALTGWKALGSADFNNDGQSDILFQTSSGSLSAWLMNKTNWVRDVLLRNNVSAGTGWKAISVSDFNADNQPDVLLQNDDGRLQLWNFNGTNYSSSTLLRGGQTAGTGWRALATADFNGDRQTDILFEHDTGTVALWVMNGQYFVSSVSLVNPPKLASTWRIAGAGDFNLDGQNDILWQNSDGKLQVWLMNGRTYVSSLSLRSGLAVSAGLRCVGPK